MHKTTGFLRDLKRGEERGVDALLRAAFGGEEEVRIVEKLRKSGAMAGESVLPGPDGPVGYFALSRFVKPKGWLCLAPVAVHPDWQGMGHGKRMTGMLAGWAMASGQTIVVLGEPDLYERAGFSRARAARLTSPFPLSHTMLLAPGADAPEAELIYPSAFQR
ncbi:N-acetyltransferase [Primorskyibacter aestuariivivens]|uniref:GNAT family N-acetyltransferase n=1 Tax=Primorskyibacter aestuariivivens TaxID=1888912 RepID=UPI0023018DF3|nr:N-acetyltransferase [Primorskyibacter aestuariivivens]MDA7428184.1 N-acetyltransferase [Primorskyibacter aestuariivivens]